MKEKINQSRFIDTLLFDLDGTLVEMNSLFKYPLYVKGFWRFSKVIYPWNFYKAFWNGISELLANQTDSYNYDVFVSTLLSYCKKNDKMALEKVISDILDNDFPKLMPFFSEVPGALRTIQMCKKKGYRLILATNPVFPQKAVHVRLKGGGFDPSDFEIITHSQNMSRCKPQVEYYEELVTRFHLDPKRCLMIGNDGHKDLGAAEVGILTYLLKTKKSYHKIKDYLHDPRAYKIGGMNDIYENLESGDFE